MAETSNETEIRQLVENWAKAVRARDMEGVLAHHADDMFDVPLPLQSRGIDEYKKDLGLVLYPEPGRSGSFDLTELQITASDTVADCHALLKIFNSTARLTIGLRKERGQWLIGHEHHSYPSS